MNPTYPSLKSWFFSPFPIFSSLSFPVSINTTTIHTEDQAKRLEVSLLPLHPLFSTSISSVSLVNSTCVVDLESIYLSPLTFQMQQISCLGHHHNLLTHSLLPFFLSTSLFISHASAGTSLFKNINHTLSLLCIKPS